MGTRNTLLDVWDGCYDLQEERISLSELSDLFMDARRLLRADLQLEDIREIPTELRGLVSTLRGDFDKLSTTADSEK